MNELSASQQIDAIIAMHADWRGQKLAQLRDMIVHADPRITEEVKWKKPSKPEGVAVWAYQGTLCIADVLKNAVRLTFPKGASMSDPQSVFNTRLDSKTVRAIDFHEGDSVDSAALQALITSAINLHIQGK